MKVILAAAVAFLLVTGIQAQSNGRVSGRVTKKGIPIANALVVLQTNTEGLQRIRTDDDGHYAFENVRPGRYSVSVEWVKGAAFAFSSVAVTKGSATTNLDFEVERSFSIGPIRESVTVSAGQLQTPEEISKTVNVIDSRQMRDRADFSLTESVRTIPGFRIQQLGGFGRTANIKTRGLRNQDTAFLIDGIRFRDPTAITGDASPFISDFTLTSIDRIEVLRGSGSSLYGTNAVGGVLDFQTPNARERIGTHGQIGGAFGGLGLGRFRANISHAITSNVGVNAGLSRTVYTKGIDGDDDAQNTNLQGRLDAGFFKTWISGRVFFSDAKLHLNVNPDTRGTPPPNVSTIIDAIPNVTFTSDLNDPDARQKSRFFDGQFVVDHLVTPELFIKGYYQGLTTRRRNDDGPLGPGFQSPFTSIYEGSIHTANAHVTWVPTGGKNTLTAGYEFEQEHFRNDNMSGADISNASASQRSHTFYAQDLVSLMDGNLQLAGGFRVQSFDLGTLAFSASAPPVLTQRPSSIPTAKTFDGAVSYYFRPTGTKLRAHAGNGYRVPSLYERFGSYFFFGSFYPLGNPTLKPEHSIGTDAGLEQFLSHERVKLSATWFYTRIKDEITYLPTSNFNESAYYNFDRHFSRGAEASADIKATSRTDVFLSYTFTNSDVRNFRRPTGMTLASADRRAFGIPDHQFTAVATQRFGRAWVNFDLLVTSNYLAQIFSNSTFNTYTYKFRGNRRGDLTAGYTFGFAQEKWTLRVYGTVENVFNNEYYENGFRTAKANARIGATFGF